MITRHNTSALVGDVNRFITVLTTSTSVTKLTAGCIIYDLVS